MTQEIRSTKVVLKKQPDTSGLKESLDCLQQVHSQVEDAMVEEPEVSIAQDLLKKEKRLGKKPQQESSWRRKTWAACQARFLQKSAPALEQTENLKLLCECVCKSSLSTQLQKICTG